MHRRSRWFSLLLCCCVVGELHAQRSDPAAALVEQLERHGGRVIVGLRAPGGRQLKQADALRLAETLRPAGFTPRRHYRIIPAASGTIAPGKLHALRSHPNVAYVQPDYRNERIGFTHSPMMAESTPYGITTIRAPDAWAATAPPNYGEGVKVGILDTGGDPLHEDLRYAGGFDGVSLSTDSTAWADTRPQCGGHGTHVAGTVAAIRDNDRGVVGVAPGVSLYAVKFFDAWDFGDGELYCVGFTSDELAAIDWIVQNGIQVVNMSFGKPSYDLAEHEAIRAAVAQGIVFVAGAGNSDGPVIYPAANAEVIAVSATDERDNRAEFSSYGPAVDVAAPGVAVYSTLPNNNYAAYSGTSMASPHVTGLAALLRARAPGLTPAQVRAFILGWARDLGSSGVDDMFGAGRVDAMASVTALLGPPPPLLSVERQPGGAVSGQPLTQQPSVQLRDAAGQPIAQAGVLVSATLFSGPGQLTRLSAPVGTAAGPSIKRAPFVAVQSATVVTDQTGSATFTNVTISGLGVHVLEFSAAGYISVQSNEFLVDMPPPVPLTNGVASQGIAGLWGSQQDWVLSVPPEAVRLSFTTSGGWGDPDLYVRKGTPPDFENWDCRSWSYTTDEYCEFSQDLAGDWYVMIHGYDSFGDVSLLGHWRAAPAASALGIVRQSGGAPAGQLLTPQPVIELRDQDDQPVAVPGVIVTVAANRSGILTDVTPPALHAVTDAQGRATFDGLIFTEHGTHALTFSVPDVAVATQTVIVSQPLPPTNVVVQALLDPAQLAPSHASYLDAAGNADGLFNLGDVLAFLDRAGATTSATASPRSTTVRRQR